MNKESHDKNTFSNIVKIKLKRKEIGHIRKGKRSNQKKLSQMLIFAGVNPAGARSKWPTWKKIIRQSNASLWTVQETKCSQANQLKMDDFIIYENVRNMREGGGVTIQPKSKPSTQTIILNL